jgi:hypothetical protein
MDDDRSRVAGDGIQKLQKLTRDNSGWCLCRRLKDRSCSYRACEAFDPKSSMFSNVHNLFSLPDPLPDIRIGICRYLVAILIESGNKEQLSWNLIKQEMELD